MSRKGYQAEYECKKKLIEEFGFLNVFKNAISNQGADYLVVMEGRLVKCVEVKECHGKKYYPLPDEKEQLKRILTFCEEHKIIGEVWIKYPNRGWEIKNIKDYLKTFIDNKNENK